MHTRKCEACTESDNCEELHLERVDRGERGKIIDWNAWMLIQKRYRRETILQAPVP
jgi:hypothetical protein